MIENEEFALSISPAGYAVSLIHKATGEECLYEGAKEPLCGITEYRPYDNELFLTYPAKERTFHANKIWREGDSLKVQFEEIAYTATIALQIEEALYWLQAYQTRLQYRAPRGEKGYRN